jgi:hypothetical protein
MWALLLSSAVSIPIDYTPAYTMFSALLRRHKKTRMPAVQTLRNSMHIPSLLDQAWPQEKTAI